MAAGTDLTVGRAAGRLGDDIDERVGAGLHIGQRRAGHTAGTVQHERDIRRIGYNIRRGGERKGNPQGTVAFDPIHADCFIGIGNAHSETSIRGIRSPYTSVYVRPAGFDTVRPYASICFR